MLATILTALTLATGIGIMEFRRAQVAATINAEWRLQRVSKVLNLGSTRKLEILPLVNWHARSSDLLTEPGVSYLVRTDTMTILFDVGFNRDEARPAPIERNMATLGVRPSEIDAVFISHRHRDHVGGVAHERAGTVSIGANDRDLAGRVLFAPVPLAHSAMTTVVLSAPGRIGTGIATSGPISRALFSGRIEEQALVVNVEGRGLVVIVGCGHQTVPKLLQRIDAAFGEPLYGIVGDLHYPVPKGRLSLWGIDAQRRLASGDGIFAPIDSIGVMSDLDLLASRRLGLVALGAHDTNDEVIASVASRFGPRFRRVQIGSPIKIGAR
jgi:metal-dependent hydrolase (beta-lactamase superfamily II)